MFKRMRNMNRHIGWHNMVAIKPPAVNQTFSLNPILGFTALPQLFIHFYDVLHFQY